MDFQNKNWIEILKYWSDTNPNKIIFKEFGKAQITYSEFYEKVCDVAALLTSRYTAADLEKPVIVSVDRDIPSLIMMLGVYAAGGWYVPMDSTVPADRATLFLNLCDPACVLLATEKDPFKESNVSKIYYTDLSHMPYTEVSRDTEKPMFGIFTSGSTGIPKLVVKNDCGISSFIREYCRIFSLTHDEIFGNQIPFYFDASTKDIFSTIYLGATSVIFSQQIFTFPIKLVQALMDEHISTFVCVPSVLVVASNFQVFSELMPHELKNILFVGEKMPVNHLNYLVSALPSTTFINLYGSTEVAGNSCYYKVEGIRPENEVLPIGHAFNTSRVFLLNEDKLPDKEGEICVAGSGLALCYYKDPDKTNAAFETLSLTGTDFSGRIYHSGDFGRINEKGELVCISRKDAQIKHMGHRIELGDIETCALSLPYISECCCLFSKTYEKILLFCICEESARKQLRKDLSKQLPKYMIPHAFIFLSELPHNRNGKTDRVLLLNNWEKEENIIS